MVENVSKESKTNWRKDRLLGDSIEVSLSLHGEKIVQRQNDCCQMKILSKRNTLHIHNRTYKHTRMHKVLFIYMHLHFSSTNFLNKDIWEDIFPNVFFKTQAYLSTGD